MQDSHVSRWLSLWTLTKLTLILVANLLHFNEHYVFEVSYSGIPITSDVLKKMFFLLCWILPFFNVLLTNYTNVEYQPLAV